MVKGVRIVKGAIKLAIKIVLNIYCNHIPLLSKIHGRYEADDNDLLHTNFTF